MGIYWYPALGWTIFWIVLILAIIMFATYKKFYPVMYLVSVALYIFTVGFTIDVFEIGKGGILMTLILSAIIFIVLGVYFSRVVVHLEPAKPKGDH